MGELHVPNSTALVKVSPIDPEPEEKKRLQGSPGAANGGEIRGCYSGSRKSF
jgi:hypothetical protein